VTRLRLRSILLLALPLASCWGGQTFYTPSETRPALPPGVYRAVPVDEPKQAETVRVSILGNGMTSIAGKGDANVVGFVPLDASYFVMWQPDAEGGPGAIYALLHAERGHYRLIIPFCEKTMPIAMAAGAEVTKDPKVKVCSFKTRAQLEDGLRHLEAEKRNAVDLLPMAGNMLTPHPRHGP
jgi:hypothetical protein